MSNVAKLKKRAAEYELKKQFDKALAVYVELLEDFDAHAEELDVALFNRVGDLLMRQGNVADAVDYYERAVDHYAEGGFFNNAIALCNKILRHSPGRASIYYKLGKISAKKGFATDGKRNFLEYADRMQKSGNMDEAFRALKEFADLCPDQDDIRLMLADQLSKLNRRDEAIEQLQKLYERYTADGRHNEAQAAVDRMKTIDPSAEPLRARITRQQSSADLVFLDLDAPIRGTPASVPTVPQRQPVGPPPAAPPPARPIEPPALSLEAPPAPPEVDNQTFPTPAFDSPAFGGQPLDGVSHGAGLDPASGDDVPSLLSGFERTTLDDGMSAIPSPGMLDLEPTSLDSDPATPVEPPLLDFDGSVPLHRSDQPTHDAGKRPTGDLDFVPPSPEPRAPRRQSQEILAELDPPMLRTQPTGAPAPASLVERPADPDFGALVDAAPSEPRTASPVSGLPLMELDEPVVARTPRRPSAPVPEPSLADDDTPVTPATPTAPVPRASTMFAARSVDVLRAAVDGAPDDVDLRRQLAEAMLEAGKRGDALHELDTAMVGAERAGHLDTAFAIAEEIGRLEPGAVRHHQKRVEYAFRLNDKPRLVEAYLALGEALVHAEQHEKAQAVYQRVLDIAPKDMRAQTAVETIAAMLAARPAPPPPPTPARSTLAMRVSTSRTASSPTPALPSRPVAPVRVDDGEFVNLGDLLLDDEAPKDTRMVVEEREPTGDEDADFHEMLRRFKQGVAENIEEEDHESHYDLGVAYKEMGLVDEAIAEFQKALRGPAKRSRAYEALGQCFLEKGQLQMAYTILSRALGEKGVSDDQLVGVLYLLGRAAEGLNKKAEALGFYQRVFVVDIEFRDVAQRIEAVERAAR